MLKTVPAFAFALALTLSLHAGARADSAEASDLVGTTWVAEEIEGQGVLERPQSTLTFPSQEQIAGVAGCNRFFGTVTFDGPKLEIGNTGGTRMACAPAIDDQEQRFLKTLPRVHGFALEDGKLTLTDEDGRTLLSLRRQEDD